jgi:outer membrane lipoprotein SlyB
MVTGFFENALISRRRIWHMHCFFTPRFKGQNGRHNEMSTIGQTFAMRILAVGFAVTIFAGCSGGPMTTREKGAGIGALGGAAAGGIIGATVGHPGAGAAIGGALGLGAGALIGDYMQGQEQTNQQQIQQNQRVIESNRQETQRLRQTEY